MKALTLDQVLALRSDLTSEDIAEIKAGVRDLLPLAAIRERAGITQAEMATRLGKSQAAVSKFEGRGDFLLSTLYRHVSAIGWDLSVSISSHGTSFELVPSEFDEDVGFSLAEIRREGPHALAEHARQYSSVKPQPRPTHFKKWVRPSRRTAHDRTLFQALGEPA